MAEIRSQEREKVQDKRSAIGTGKRVRICKKIAFNRGFLSTLRQNREEKKRGREKVKDLYLKEKKRESATSISGFALHILV